MLCPMSEQEQNHPSDGTGGSATSGCIILAAIITVFGGLIILYVTMFFVQNKALGGFTTSEPADLPIVTPTDDQKTQLDEKLFAVKAAASQEKSERILFNKDDLNTMLSTIEILKDFQGTTYVDSISTRGIETRMSQPMRKLPFSSERRYLNARFIFQPELRKRTIALRVKDIISDEGTVPEGFVKNYDAIGFFRIDPENPAIKPIIPKLSRVYTESGHVVIETGKPADDQSPPSGS